MRRQVTIAAVRAVRSVRRSVSAFGRSSGLALLVLALPTLSGDLTASNWLLESYPDVYLYAAAVEGGVHAFDLQTGASIWHYDSELALSGGPGAYALPNWEYVIHEPLSVELVGNRDWIIIDQRGTGRSSLVSDAAALAKRVAEIEDDREFLRRAKKESPGVKVILYAGDLKAFEDTVLRIWNMGFATVDRFVGYLALGAAIVDRQHMVARGLLEEDRL